MHTVTVTRLTDTSEFERMGRLLPGYLQAGAVSCEGPEGAA